MIYAIDTHTQKWCKADQADRTKSYVCGCPDRHRVSLKRGCVRAAHFAHWSADGCCRGGGESEEHREAKQLLRERAGSYYFVTEKCPECGEETLEDCSDGTVNIEVSSEDRRWRYDCVYTSVRGYSIALEVLHTHATTQQKIEATHRNGVGLAEFRAEDINAMTGERTLLHNLQIVKQFCCCWCANQGDVRRIEAQKARERLLAEEQRQMKTERRLKQEAELRRAFYERRERENHEAEKRSQEELTLNLALKEEQFRLKRLEYLAKLENKKKKRKKPKPANTFKLSVVPWIEEKTEAAKTEYEEEDDGFAPSRIKQRRLDQYLSKKKSD
jgi:hypothetical protein